MNTATVSERNAGERIRTPTQEEIASTAYQLYLAQGCQPGYELEDWIRAEQILSQEFENADTSSGLFADAAAPEADHDGAEFSFKEVESEPRDPESHSASSHRAPVRSSSHNDRLRHYSFSRFAN